jgi:HEAT repeat protein
MINAIKDINDTESINALRTIFHDERHSEHVQIEAIRARFSLRDETAMDDLRSTDSYLDNIDKYKEGMDLDDKTVMNDLRGRIYDIRHPYNIRIVALRTIEALYGKEALEGFRKILSTIAHDILLASSTPTSTRIEAMRMLGGLGDETYSKDYRREAFKAPSSTVDTLSYDA